MTEDQEIDDSDDPLFDPLLDEIQFGGIGIGETWRVQTDIEEFLQKYARHVGLADVTLKYTIGDQLGTRSLYLHLSDRCLFSHEVVVGIQTEVLTKWPQWTVALAGYSREGEIASISANSVTVNSQRVNDVSQFMQEFADKETAEWQRRFGPLRLQIQFVESQLGHMVTITADQPFYIVAICEHWPKPDEYFGVWVIGDSDIDEVAIFVPGEEPLNGGTQFAVSPAGKLLNYLMTGPNGNDVRPSEYWVNQFLIPRHYRGPHLIAQRDSDSRQWTISFDRSTVRTNSELQQVTCPESSEWYGIT